ncbi:MAG TPA: hypothetical protein V6D23_09340, partial [Candidatus Obscuribacterales bacterium]
MLISDVSASIQTLDAAALQQLSPALQGRIREAGQTGKARVILEDAQQVQSLSLDEFLQQAPEMGTQTRAYMVTSAEGRPMVVPLARLSRVALEQALDQLSQRALTPLPDPLLADLRALRSKVQQRGVAVDIGPELSAEDRRRLAADAERHDFAANWRVEALGLDEDAFVERFAREQLADGSFSYAIPPELCRELFARIGPDKAIDTWPRLEQALRELGVPETRIQALHAEQIEAFENQLAKEDRLIGEPFAEPAAYTDSDIDRGELFQSLGQDQVLSLDEFTDLMSGVVEDGVSTYAVPPETCHLILKAVGQQILNWDVFTKVFRDVGVPEANIAKIYAKVAAHFVARAKVPDNSVLYIASRPQALPGLDLDGEVSKLRQHLGRQNVVAVHDPSLAEIEALIKTGKFSRVWVAGHGIDGQVCLTDQQGRRKDTVNAELARVLASHPAVKAVMASICWGAFGGQASLVDQLQKNGVQAAGYESAVDDSFAVWISEKVAAKLQAGKSFPLAVREAFLESDANPGKQPKPSQDPEHYLDNLSAPALQQAHSIAAKIASEVEGCYGSDKAEKQARLQRIIQEYPGLQPILAYIAQLQKGDAAQAKALLSAHPEMQQVAKALAADWKSRPASLTPPQIPGYVAELVRKAVDYHV